MYNQQLEKSRENHAFEIYEVAVKFDYLAELYLSYEESNELSNEYYESSYPYTKMDRINNVYAERPIPTSEFAEHLDDLNEKLEEGITSEEAVLINETITEIGENYYSVSKTDLSEMQTDSSRKLLKETSNQALDELDELKRKLEKQ
ncbi:hypothetical protein [Alkalibacillus salilacus]|uniref:Iron-sulfur cluster repair protein YtfE (RIC family) n=1 Tax=Alkalibacillus salilacus TaxID=284582 RepID=A0ABT9VHK7_9BACI|nr:hypothetical protein [Alkalibacillus salilacus]MDQ0160450.1 iron-sulfur cluster repair protein YtfE (RIC family) [Alkalibacillus salilacus]